MKGILSKHLCIIVLLLSNMILTAPPIHAAPEYVLQAVATDPTGIYGMAPVTSVSGHTYESKIPMPANMGMHAEVYLGEPHERWYRYLTTTQMRSWKYHLAAAPGYQFDSIILKMWSPYIGTQGMPDEPWQLRAGDIIIWQGRFFDQRTFSQTPRVTHIFDFATWGDLRETPLELTFEMVPEPSSMIALLAGISGLCSLVLRRR